MRSTAPIDILKQIKVLIGETSYKSYNEVAPDNAVYPFVTYELSNSFSNEDTEVFVLDINGWDSFTDAAGTQRLETMMSVITAKLQKNVKALTGASMSFHLDNRKTLHEPDTSIRRKKYTYQVRYIGRE
jgi:GH25 family lysozyme M1 (1,4-beta-N-acetylmuramidase)